ncbi:MAG: DotD/TraH family lipoprotein [Rhodanobacter sp.]
MKTVSLALTSIALLLCGCATPPAKPPQDPAANQLASAAQDIRASLTQLADAEQYDKKGRLPGTPDTTPSLPGLTASMSMPWDGPIEPIVSRLATQGGYLAEFSGKKPTLPILVSLGTQPATLSQMLRNVGLQAGDRADVVVDPARKTVEVIYANTGL